MKKTIIIFSIIGISISTIGISKISNNKISYNKNQSFAASYIIPQNLEELESKTEIIVKGRFTGETEIDKDKNVIGPSTISQFKVNKTYKGNISQDTISVIEPYKIEKKDFTNIEGYLPMEDDKEYILFLRENNVQSKKQYTIKSISFGKYNLTSKEIAHPQETKIDYLDEAIKKDFISQSESECDTYNNIKQDVLKKYTK